MTKLISHKEVSNKIIFKKSVVETEGNMEDYQVKFLFFKSSVIIRL